MTMLYEVVVASENPLSHTKMHGKVVDKCWNNFQNICNHGVQSSWHFSVLPAMPQLVKCAFTKLDIALV